MLHIKTSTFQNGTIALALRTRAVRWSLFWFLDNGTHWRWSSPKVCIQVVAHRSVYSVIIISESFLVIKGFVVILRFGILVVLFVMVLFVVVVVVAYVLFVRRRRPWNGFRHAAVVFVILLFIISVSLLLIHVLSLSPLFFWLLLNALLGRPLSHHHLFRRFQWIGILELLRVSFLLRPRDLCQTFRNGLSHVRPFVPWFFPGPATWTLLFRFFALFSVLFTTDLLDCYHGDVSVEWAK